MPKPRNMPSEDMFLTDVAPTLSDEEAAKEFEKTFNKPISKAAIRKRRQRLKLAKKGFAGKFKMKEEEDGN